MFTGIVESVGIVKRTTRRGEDVLLSINTSMSLDDVMIGDSIAVSGACLTVVEILIWGDILCLGMLIASEISARERNGQTPSYSAWK
jgi:riboflavin synthase alpha subunit